MTREKAINILIAVAVCSTEFLNCEEDCPFYHPEVEACEEWTDEQAKEAVETIAALRSQQERDNRLKSDTVKYVEIERVKNEPLTMDELRQLNGEPVYIVFGDVSWWDIVRFCTDTWVKLYVEDCMLISTYLGLCSLSDSRIILLLLVGLITTWDGRR